MFVPPISGQPVIEEQAIEHDEVDADADAPTPMDEKDDKYHHHETDQAETDADTSVSSTCRDKKSDCSIKTDSEDDKTDANASIDLSEEDNKQHCPKSDPKDMDIDTSANSICRDEESDCSVKEDSESDETDAKASVDLNKEDNGHHCLEIHSEGQMNVFVIKKESPTVEGSCRGGETKYFTLPHLIRTDSAWSLSSPSRVQAVHSDFTRNFFGRRCCQIIIPRLSEV